MCRQQGKSSSTAILWENSTVLPECGFGNLTCRIDPNPGQLPPGAHDPQAAPCSPSLLSQRELCSIPGANRKPLLSQGTLGWSLQTKYHPTAWWEQVPHHLSALCQPRWVLEKPWAEQQCGGGVSKRAALHSLGCFLELPFSIRTWMAMALDPALILELQSQVKGASFNTAANI